MQIWFFPSHYTGMKPRELANKAAKELPLRLKAARKSAKITQDELVEIAEFSPVALSKLERGINLPSFENLVALSYALKVSPNYLTGWEQEISNDEGVEKRILLNRLALTAQDLSKEWLVQLISIAEKAKQ